MKKLLIGAAGAVALTFMLQTSAVANNAATVIQDGGCFLFGPDVAPGFPSLIATDDHAVITSSGNTMLVCKFEAPAGTVTRATRNEGFPCGTYLGLTFDSKVVASPSGNVTLTCKINGN
jgi:hypothetical protein